MDSHRGSSGESISRAALRPLFSRQTPAMEAVADATAAEMLPFRNDARNWSLDHPVIETATMGLWFSGRDVASSLEYLNEGKVLRDRVDEADKLQLGQLLQAGRSSCPRGFDSLNHQPSDIYINEAGLYGLLARSKKPHAGDFKLWVTREVLPAIRTAGRCRNLAVDEVSTTAAGRRERAPTDPAAEATEIVAELVARGNADARRSVAELVTKGLVEATEVNAEMMRGVTQLVGMGFVEMTKGVAELVTVGNLEVTKGIAQLAKMHDVLKKRDSQMSESFAELSTGNERAERDGAARSGRVEIAMDKMNECLANGVADVASCVARPTPSQAGGRGALAETPQSARETAEPSPLGSELSSRQLRALNSEEEIVDVAEWFKERYLRSPPERLPTSAQELVRAPAPTPGSEEDLLHYPVFKRCRCLFVKEAERRKIQGAVRGLALLFSPGRLRIVYTRKSDAPLLEATFDELKGTRFSDIASDFASAEARKRKRSIEKAGPPVAGGQQAKKRSIEKAGPPVAEGQQAKKRSIEKAGPPVAGGQRTRKRSIGKAGLPIAGGAKSRSRAAAPALGAAPAPGAAHCAVPGDGEVGEI